MITLIILLIICGVALMLLSGFAAILLDPIIAILIIWGIYRLIKKIFSRKK